MTLKITKRTKYTSEIVHIEGISDELKDQIEEYQEGEELDFELISDLESDKVFDDTGYEKLKEGLTELFNFCEKNNINDEIIISN